MCLVPLSKQGLWWGYLRARPPQHAEIPQVGVEHRCTSGEAVDKMLSDPQVQL